MLCMVYTCVSEFIAGGVCVCVSCCMHAAVYIMWLCGIHTARVCNVLYSQKSEYPPSKPLAVKSPGSHGNSPH